MDRLVEEAEDHHQDPTHPPPSPMLTCSREGLRYQVLVHLSVLEDFAPKDLLLGTGLDGPASDEEDEYPSRVHFFWTAGVPDGSGRQHRRRAGDVLSRLGPRRDDKDDDEDRDDRADRASFQSESRARALGRAWPAASRGAGEVQSTPSRGVPAPRRGAIGVRPAGACLIVP